MKHKPTIAEVAKAANVAGSTVSRVLNGGYASAEVRARVQKVSQQLGYIPSPTARNLKMGRTGIVGLVVEVTVGSWFNEILQGVEEELSDGHLSVALCSLKLTGSYDPSIVERWVNERRVDGIVFLRASKREQPLIKNAQKLGIPLVFVGPDYNYRVGYTVRARNREAGHDAGQHLLGLGHKKIAFAGGPEGSQDSRDRLHGLEDALREAGLELEASNVSFGRNYLPESGIAYAEKWLTIPRNKAPTAVVLGNDEMALGFMRTVCAAGYVVPDDVSVVGFDGSRESALWWPGLTTATQPARKMGRSACRELLARIEDRDYNEGSSLEMPMELVVRESTGPAKGARAAKKPTPKG